MDVFNNIAINDSIKDRIKVYSNTIYGYIYKAGHGLTAKYYSNGVYDEHDYYVTFRFLGTLADYPFNGNPSAKDINLEMVLVHKLIWEIN